MNFDAVVQTAVSYINDIGNDYRVSAGARLVALQKLEKLCARLAAHRAQEVRNESAEKFRAGLIDPATLGD